MQSPREAGAGRRGRAPADRGVAADAVTGLPPAAQWPDRDATADLASAYLPLIYNIVGRALNGHRAVDEVVRQTMISAMSGVRDPRDEGAFLALLLADCVRHIRDARRVGATRSHRGLADRSPESDFAQLTVDMLGLSGERREIAEAGRWLTEEDRLLLALWWEEATGRLHRAELSRALGLSRAASADAHAYLVRHLETVRVVGRALRRQPPCRGLVSATAGWDGAPDPAWCDQLAAHVLHCPVCAPAQDQLSPSEWLVAGLPLLSPPPDLTNATRSHASGAGRRRPPEPAVRRSLPIRSWIARRGGRPSRSTIAVLAAALALCLAGGIVTVLRGNGPSPDVASGVTVGDGTRVSAAPTATGRAATGSARPSSASAPKAAAPVLTFTPEEKKGVGATAGAGVNAALAASEASWYYNWGPTPSGITTPPGVTFVPMIKNAAEVNATVLHEVKQEGNALLGFNEPDQSGEADMSVQQAIQLWPQLEATGMALGSPAVSYGTNSTSSWLGQFMLQAQARHYRVDFVTVHWYGEQHFDDVNANVNELQNYLEQTYALWGKPIWITEFALINFQHATPVYPTEAEQAAFLTAATKMLATLPFVQRYAWYGLSASGSSKGTTALFDSAADATLVGEAYEKVP
jgi:DNA-directed RNA polymerase specialized sigma24 family protein